LCSKESVDSWRLSFHMRCLATLFVVPLVAATDTYIATFDGAVDTTRSWQVVNDPVMGGRSNSSFAVDGERHLGIWSGNVALVPFLAAPGFCNLRAGSAQNVTYPDFSGSEGVVARLRQNISDGLTIFRFLLESTGAKNGWKQGVYAASFSAPLVMGDVFVPWSSFHCSWRGQSVAWCPDLTTQLKLISSVGLGTAYPGSVGSFRLELESLSVRSARSLSATSASDEYIELATFGGSADHRWHSENDPVMGGQSTSSFEVSPAGYGDYQGVCRTVPSLQAPGFTIALTTNPVFARFPDASSMDGLALGVRNVGGNVTAFKVAFCDARINVYKCQFASFKADITVEPTENFQEIFVPWSHFSDKWAAATGEHTAEEAPTSVSLKSITQLQLWTEGVLGDFHLHLKYVRASKLSGRTVV